MRIKRIILSGNYHSQSKQCKIKLNKANVRWLTMSGSHHGTNNNILYKINSYVAAKRAQYLVLKTNMTVWLILFSIHVIIAEVGCLDRYHSLLNYSVLHSLLWYSFYGPRINTPSHALYKLSLVLFVPCCAKWNIFLFCIKLDIKF